jgi:solute:Na+ symporter, SSS family
VIVTAAIITVFYTVLGGIEAVVWTDVVQGFVLWVGLGIPVAILYGLFWYGQRYVADQTTVQRYLLAKSDGGAVRGVSLRALLCVPVWTLFMLIGTCVWSFFKLAAKRSRRRLQKPIKCFRTS